MSFATAVLDSVLGMSVVFFALILLMAMIKIMTAFGDKEEDVPEPMPPAVTAAPAAVTEKKGKVYTDEVKLYDTDPRTAAMIMAIVAEASEIPLSRLHFISIREIKEDV